MSTLHAKLPTKPFVTPTAGDFGTKRPLTAQICVSQLSSCGGVLIQLKSQKLNRPKILVQPPANGKGRHQRLLADPRPLGRLSNSGSMWTAEEEPSHTEPELRSLGQPTLL